MAFNCTVHLEALRCRGSVANGVNEGKMEKSFRYVFEPYLGPKSKHQCPSCNKRGVFVRYMDQETGELIDSRAGRCDREFSCGYWLKPSEFLGEGYVSRTDLVKIAPPKPITYHPVEWVDKARIGVENTQFYNYLVKRLGEQNASWAAKEFRLGASSVYRGCIIFWQIDQQERVHGGKIFKYNTETGKRNKGFGVKWVHTTSRNSEFGLEQCLFGLHRVTEKTTTVAVVESEKTAIIMSVKTQSEADKVWVATGGASFQQIKLKPLIGKEVYFYPDFNAGDAWFKFANLDSKWRVHQLANEFVELPKGATDLADLI